MKEKAMRGTPQLRLCINAVAVLAASRAGAQATFTPVGDLPGGPFKSVLYAVSADGSVAVGWASDADGRQAAKWTSAAGLIGLGSLGGPPHTDGACTGTTPGGAVIVGMTNSVNGREAFALTELSGMVGLGDFPGGVFYSLANDISNDGSVIVGQGDSDPFQSGQAFRWTKSGGIVPLGYLPGGDSYSDAWAVSGDGRVTVGWSSSGAGMEAFKWTEADGIVGLGDLAGGDFYSAALDCSSDGSVIVGSGSVADGWEAVRWTADGLMVSLGDLPGGPTGGEAWAVSADGSVIVGDANSTADDYGVAFIWDAVRGMRDLKVVLEADHGLDLAGWTLKVAADVSADGRTIVGWGTNPSGFTEGWIVRLPAPCYADCDGSGELDIDDFICFQTEYARGCR